MALLDFLKRKDEVKKAKEKSAEEAEKPAKVFVAPKPESASVKTPAGKVKAVKDFSYEAVKQPHISEKAGYLAAKNQYIFQVSPNYNKQEIKKSIEGIYGVDVLSVNVVKIPAKKRRIGRQEGFRKCVKKAIIKIKEGQKIEII